VEPLSDLLIPLLYVLMTPFVPHVVEYFLQLLLFIRFPVIILLQVHLKLSGLVYAHLFNRQQLSDYFIRPSIRLSLQQIHLHFSQALKGIIL